MRRSQRAHRAQTAHRLLVRAAIDEKVVGFSHRSMDMGPGGTYHILSKGGVDRGGVTGHLPGGVPPHWLPYVFVDDADATIARPRKLGATIQAGDAPGVRTSS